MPRIDTEYDVYMDDGTELLVRPDQRDYAAWEVQEFAVVGRWQLQARFIAWSALRRRGDYKQPFDRFNNVDCVEVAVHGDDEADGEGEQGPRP